MIILDTNVVSEAMKPQPDTKVLAWLDSHSAEALYLTSITVAELLFGLAVLPDGGRKGQLSKAINETIGMFQNRVLPFGTEAARSYAALAALARQKGRGLPTPDGYSERTLPSVQIGMLRRRLPFRSPPFVDALKPLPVLGFAPLADFRHPRRAARSIISAV